MRVIRLALGVVLVVVAIGMPSVEGQTAGAWAGHRSSMRSFLKSRESRMTLDNLDLSRLQGELERRQPGIPSHAVCRRVEENVRFLFFNKLNRDHFLAIPPPRVMVERMEEVLSRNENLMSLLRSGRELKKPGSSQKERARLVRRIGDEAKSIRNIFRDYFKEFSSRSLTVGFPLQGSSQTNFRRYLGQTERISRLLDREVERYFFSAGPSVIDVSSYNRYSVQALSDSLHSLSRATVKHIR